MDTLNSPFVPRGKALLTKVEAPPTAQKRDHDGFLTTSSDPPLFSSDGPIYDSSALDYEQPRQKRQHPGPWYGKQHVTVMKRRQPGIQRPRRKEPLRKVDSGVYLGSDESTGSELLAEHEAAHDDLQLMGVHGMNDAYGAMSEQEDEKSGIFTEPKLASLVDKAMQTVDDPGDFGGPVFPYWQKQPESLHNFHMFQQHAYEKVLGAVEHGEEVVDLSNCFLTQVRAPTLRPLRFYTKQEKQETAPNEGRRPKYQRLTPSLRLFLINNDLSSVPSELYHLTNLEVLSLRNNSITEILPMLSRLTSLKELNLASNSLPHLPYTLLSLLRANLQTLHLTPNPFLRPQPSTYHRLRPLSTPKTTSASPEFIASTAPAFLSITGDALRSYPPAPSQTPSHWPNPSEIPAHCSQPSPESRHHTPSLLELCLRALSCAPELSQLPFHMPSDYPHLTRLLERTWRLTQAGGQECTICGAQFVVPRTEWIEWWARDGNVPIPFLRRGCSWECFEERSGQAVGWSSGEGPGEER